jgi:hypothetical protein
MVLRSNGFLLTILLCLSSQVAHAENVRLKTSQDCRSEYSANAKALEDIGKSRGLFMSICLKTPAGVPTDATGWKSFMIEPPPERSGPSHYKSGFRYTPAYLSSPQLTPPFGR